jgi:dTDP-4-dehydrorhamnose reductase
MATRVLVTGATGHLGAYLVRELTARQVEVIAWGRSQPKAPALVTTLPVELTDSSALSVAFANARPELIIHAAAEANVVECAEHPEKAEAVNARATAALTKLCDAVGTRLVFVSTDLVFDGEWAPYAESNPVAPLSVYGRTKSAGELAVLTSRRNAVVRVSWMFGPSLIERTNFFDKQVAALRGGSAVPAFHDEWRTPLGLATAARALIGIAASDVIGLLHVGGPERMSRLEIGQRLAAYLGTGTVGLVSASRLDVPGEPRPRDVSLDSRRWRRLFPNERWPTFEEALDEMCVR